MRTRRAIWSSSRFRCHCTNALSPRSLPLAISVTALHLLVASISCAVLVLLLDDLSSINSQANCVALKALKIRYETKTTSEREGENERKRASAGHNSCRLIAMQMQKQKKLHKNGKPGEGNVLKAHKSFC